MKRNWNEIKARFAACDLTLKEFAAAEGIPYDTVMTHSARDGWTEARQNIGKKTAEKSAERTARKRAGRVSDGLSALTGFAVTWAQRLEAFGTECSAKKFPDAALPAARAARQCYDLLREIGGTSTDRERLEIEKKRLALEEKKQQQENTGGVRIILETDLDRLAE